MAVYQAKIVSIEPTANGTVNADVFIELRTGTSPDFVWIPASNGHFTLVLTADEILSITENTSLTNVQKRQAIKDVIKARTLERGIEKSDEAFLELNKLFTYPDTITIRG